MTNLTVGIIQMCSGVDASENVLVMEGLVRDAAGRGARYIQTPEMTGLVDRHPKSFFDKIVWGDDDLVVKSASSLSSELGVWLHIGSTPIRLSDDRAANRGFLFSPSGDIAATYDKIHMFDVDLDNGESWRESSVYSPGDAGVLVSVDDIRLGLAICYDLRFPRLFREYSLSGADVLTCPSCFTRQTGEAHWHILLRSRAIENGAFVIASAQSGVHADGRETYGHSLIVNPWGEIILEIENEGVGVAVCDIELDEVSLARNKIPSLKNSRDFGLKDSGGSL